MENAQNHRKCNYILARDKSVGVCTSVELLKEFLKWLYWKQISGLTISSI